MAPWFGKEKRGASGSWSLRAAMQEHDQWNRQRAQQPDRAPRDLGSRDVRSADMRPGDERSRHRRAGEPSSRSLSAI